jgi:O-antigen/teichoic acid export membrane protein
MLFLASWMLTIAFNWRALRSAASSIPASVNAVRSAGLIGSTLLFTQIYGNADLLLVKWFVGDVSAGHYRLAQAIASAVMPSLSVVSFVYVSELQNLIGLGQRGRLWPALRRQILIHVVLGLAVFLVMALFLQWAVVFFYGESAIAAIRPSLILTGAAAVNALAIVFSYTLLALHKDGDVLLATGLAACGNVALNVLSIPQFGVVGAAWSAVGTYALLTAILAIASLRHFKGELASSSRQDF